MTYFRQVPLYGLEAIWRDDEVIGMLRRADYAYMLNKPLGYGVVTRTDGGVVTADYLKSGNYFMERMGTKYPAKLHMRSPFDPTHKRVNGVYE